MALTKLSIVAYSSGKYQSGEVKGKFEVLINPETYKRELDIDYDKTWAVGSPGGDLRFKKMNSEKISFSLIFDGTGLISTAPQSLKEGDKIKPVLKQIEEFKAVVAEFSGEIHRPYFLLLTWGDSFNFQGVLTSMSINYKLFKPDGTPIRAVADVTFSSSVSPALAMAKAGLQSPDVTHVKQVRAGDRLPAMCNDIYDDLGYFVQVAEANQLNHLRQIPTGTSLIFPPLRNK